MTEAKKILSQMDGVYKPQMKFMTTYLDVLSCFQGKANLTNLHRYGGPHPRRAFRWFQQPFDYLSFNQRYLESNGICKNELALAIDATFVKKSGKKTHGLGYFYNGCSGKTEKGLELSVIAAIDLTENTAYALDVKQSIPKPEEGVVAKIVEQLEENKETLQAFSPILIADGWYAKEGIGQRKHTVHGCFNG